MAASTMYKMKPIYGHSDVVEDYPTCMYTMKNVHADSDDDTDFNENPEFLELKNRQEAVLHELEKLKREFDQIGVDIGMDSQRESTSKSQVPSDEHLPISTAIPCNIVVKACLDDPPFSVYLLHRLVQQHGLDCSTKSHVHSSWTSQVPKELFDLFHTSCNKGSSSCLRFIWKSDILAPSLMVSVADQSPILGEANILRYLARLFLPRLYSENPLLQMAIIDDWLNAALKFTSAKDGKTFIQNLNSHLGKHSWLASNAPSIADIYCSVALLKNNCGGQLPKNVSKWMAECRKAFPCFEKVEKLCK